MFCDETEEIGASFRTQKRKPRQTDGQTDVKVEQLFILISK